jgi:hypothetical protein
MDDRSEDDAYDGNWINGNNELSRPMAILHTMLRLLDTLSNNGSMYLCRQIATFYGCNQLVMINLVP